MLQRAWHALLATNNPRCHRMLDRAKCLILKLEPRQQQPRGQDFYAVRGPARCRLRSTAWRWLRRFQKKKNELHKRPAERLAGSTQPQCRSPQRHSTAGGEAMQRAWCVHLPAQPHSTLRADCLPARRSEKGNRAESLLIRALFTPRCTQALAASALWHRPRLRATKPVSRC